MRLGVGTIQRNDCLWSLICLNSLTSPSSGQASTTSLLRHHNLFACHSGAAFEGSEDQRLSYGLETSCNRVSMGRQHRAMEVHAMNSAESVVLK